MPLLARTVNAPLLVAVQRGGLDALPELLTGSSIARPGTAALVIGTRVGPSLLPSLDASLEPPVTHEVGASTVDEARRLEAALHGVPIDAVVAVGGGGTLDVGKWAATMLGLPFVAIATNLAHDGLASPVAVLESDGFKRSFGVHAPLGVVVDLDLVSASSPEHTRSGIGDVTSNISAVADWELGHEVHSEPLDGLASALARTAADAVVRHTSSIDADDFLDALARALILSGIAMSVAGTSRPASGACHEISHAVDRLYPGTAPHGTQVAVGTMFASFLRGDPYLSTLDACLRRYGVPRTPTDLGIEPDAFVKAVLEAPSTRPGRYTILEHLDLDQSTAEDKVHAFLEAFDH